MPLPTLQSGAKKEARWRTDKSKRQLALCALELHFALGGAHRTLHGAGEHYWNSVPPRGLCDSLRDEDWKSSLEVEEECLGPLGMTVLSSNPISETKNN